MVSKGFSVISAAAFIGENSYSTEQYPIAVEYGCKIRGQLKNGIEKKSFRRNASGSSDDSRNPSWTYVLWIGLR